MKYLVSIERSGRPVPVGSIEGESTDGASFRYSEAYLSEPEAAPISLSLPLQADPFTPQQTRCFFDSLLPEGYTRRSVTAYLKLDEADYLSILLALGQECLGALRIYQEGEAAHARYERLTEAQVKELASEGASTSTALVTEARLSLAGASGKVGLYYYEKENAWYLPRGTTPSTHIVKQSHVRYKEIVPNEQLCLATAALCGLRVAPSFILDTGKGEDKDVLLVSKRYDRTMPDDPATVDGLPVPLRRHQEDMAQALGIPAAEKYERGRHYLRDMFALLRTHSARPIEDQLELWDRIVFNFLIGNADAHIKNFSLLYAPDLRSLRLAPAYDIIHTGYEGLSQNLAFAIGGVTALEEITRDSFRLAAKDVGLGERMALARLDALVSRFPSALSAAADELHRQGVPSAPAWRDNILAGRRDKQISK